MHNCICSKRQRPFTITVSFYFLVYVRPFYRKIYHRFNLVLVLPILFCRVLIIHLYIQLLSFFVYTSITLPKLALTRWPAFVVSTPSTWPNVQQLELPVALLLTYSFLLSLFSSPSRQFLGYSSHYSLFPA